MKVAELRDLTHASILDLHRSIGGYVPDIVPPNPLDSRDRRASPPRVAPREPRGE